MVEQHGKTLVPQIRFAGFTDPWEQRKLGELCSFSKGCGYSKNDLRDQGTPIILYGRLYTNYETQIHSVDTFVKPLENSVYSEGGEVIIPASGETAEDISIASVVEKPGIILGGDLNVITSSADIDPVFLALELSYGKPHFDLAKRAQGKSVVHIHNEDIANVFFGHPNIAEQRRIGAFFDRLDSLITLHQRKYDKLCVLKKSMLDKMFPKGGSLYPEIRFAGFTDPWEQRKLGDILQERNVRTSDFESNPIFSLTIEDGITPKTDRYERTSLITKTEDLFKIVSPNEFVTNPMNLRFGAFGYNKNSFSVCVSGYYDVFSIDNDKCSGFWNSYFKTSVALKRFDDAATGSLIEKRRVKYSTLCQLIFLMPKGMDEKKRIGAFFDRLDSLITLHQRKLELLRNIKKSMLDKMFV
ncbi:restriction endonuclease subunit S [Bifidobacterium adolescentis]|uniref:restriction endonuclease subunit S n=1 Tax=Bifidobacterium adolescentis TaxID=1680 RepID=UPI0022E3D9DC|nr:restriction endonuclease subunit S [Bifidobacterium adolescentis]